MTEQRKVRVRFAPSPTGPLHMGGVRTALYNYLFAKKNNGDFLLRIEDTDQNRYVKGAEDYIRESLEWCGIIPDEGQGYGGDLGPYRQSERKELGFYKEHAEKLVADGKAYYAFDTAEELEKMREDLKKAGVAAPQYNAISRGRMKNALTLPADEVQQRIESGEPYVIRVKIPRNEEVKFEDVIRGWVMVHSSNLDDKVLFKSDGMPTYHLANIIDDYMMGITHVIRGEEWLPSAPLHVLLYEYLGFADKMPSFAHLPLLLKPDGNGKLSKRDGDRLGFPVFPLEWKDPETNEVSSGYREKGYFPEAFINILSLLGWNPGTNQEVFSMQELINSFSLERVGKAGAKYDPEKARWFNQQYLKEKDNLTIAKALLERTDLQESAREKGESYLAEVCGLMKERAVFLKDIPIEGYYLFEAPNSYDEKTIQKKWKDDTSELMNEWKSILASISEKEFTSEKVEAELKAFIEAKEVGFGAVLPPFRLLLSGTGMGPSIFAIAELLGQEECVKRMSDSMQAIQK